MEPVNTTKSSALFARAERVIPGGVNSPVRAFRSVGRQPLFIKEARGASITDVDGNVYIDYVGSWGPMILGHAHPEIVRAIQEAAPHGTSFGASTELEVELAEEVARAFPSIQRVRFVSSGTEATMSAIRLARGATGRDQIVKFEGCYHGHSDSLLVKAGSGLATYGTPDSAGVPAAVAQNTIVLPYNDADAVRNLFGSYGSQIACVIIEPVAGNMGCVAPAPGFLQAVKDAASGAGAVLIFDEVITGFRVAYGGAQELYGIQADLTCLGKIIGGGLPVGAFGGRADLMEQIAPMGPVYQAGTLSGNPLAMSAGLAALKLLRQLNPYSALDQRAGILEEGLRRAAIEAGIPAVVNRIGSMLTAFFNDGPVMAWNSASRSNTERYARFFREMLDRGVYLAPSQFECAFIGLEHSEDLIEKTLRAAIAAMTAIAK